MSAPNTKCDRRSSKTRLSQVIALLALTFMLSSAVKMGGTGTFQPQLRLQPMAPVASSSVASGSQPAFASQSTQSTQSTQSAASTQSTQSIESAGPDLAGQYSNLVRPSVPARSV